MSKKQYKKSSSRKDIKPKKVRSKPERAPGSALMIEPGFWKKNKIPALLLFILPFILYTASFQYGFVLDDVIVLSENSYVKKGISGIGDILSNDVFTGYLGNQQDLVEGGRYRPLSLVSFAVEYELFGLNPMVNHISNVIWYAFLGLLIFRVLGILFPGAKRWYFSIPFFAALLFICHPVHSEAVANIKGRDEIMTFTLVMAALYYSLRYLAGQKILPLILSGILFFLALLAKENALTFLAVIPLTIYTFTNATLKENLRALIPLGIATLIYLIIRYQVIGYFLGSGEEVTGLMNNPFRDMTGNERYATIFYTLWEYIRLLFFPYKLTHDYYPYQVPIIGWADLRSILPFLLYTVLGVYALLGLRKRGNVVGYAILFYLITLSITSNLVFTVGTFMNERFLFIPSLGFTLLLSWWAVRYLPKRLGNVSSIQYILLGLVLLIAGAYTYRTIARVPVWETSFTLNQAAVKVSVNSARANNFMGYDYYTMATEESDREKKRELLDLSTPYIDRALEIHPTYPDALRVKAGLEGSYYQLDGDLEDLLNDFYKLLSVRHVPFIDTYMEYLNKRGGASQLINFYHNAGYVLFAQTRGHYALARKYLNYAYQLDPNNSLILQDVCIVSYMQGQYQQAMNIGTRALQIDPTLGEAKKYVELSRKKLGGS